tara:strand:+ start:126 stop:269 length:144 start_codon:yes stop_codon:yes gene_type:complete
MELSLWAIKLSEEKDPEKNDGCHFAPFPKLIPNEANASFNGKTDLCS